MTPLRRGLVESTFRVEGTPDEVKALVIRDREWLEQRRPGLYPLVRPEERVESYAHEGGRLFVWSVSSPERVLSPLAEVELEFEARDRTTLVTVRALPVRHRGITLGFAVAANALMWLMITEALVPALALTLLTTAMIFAAIAVARPAAQRIRDRLFHEVSERLTPLDVGPLEADPFR